MRCYAPAWPWPLLPLLLLGAANVRAQDFFRVSPGPLNASHAAYDHADGCTKCHEVGAGVTNDLCLKCHEELQKELSRGEGLHAGYRERCIKCHPDHKGRQFNIIDWKPLGGRERFEHIPTGFVLRNRHAALACTACHSRKMKSGRPSFLGLSKACASCHPGVHGFARQELAASCEQCHPDGQAGKDLSIRTWKGAHAELSRVPLGGKHLDQRCVKCHPGAMMKGRAEPRTCGECHKSRHPSTAGFQSCPKCHQSNRPWKAASYKHDSRFPLHGRHEELDCVRCHKKNVKLTYRVGGCPLCHPHKNAHGSQFADKPCALCHVEGGERDVPFNHNKDSRFPLEGAHLELARKDLCQRCHPKRIYRTNKIHCRDCHKDSHRGELGEECGRCHNPKSHFKGTRIDHERTSRFPLSGAHLKAKCEACHPDRRFKRASIACIECHEKRDPHRGKLGRDCARCHVPDKGAPRFQHETMTRFPRTGAHLRVGCCFCHVPPRPAEALPEPGWTRNLPQLPVDRLFPVSGKTCGQCHRDSHQGRFGLACERCHTTEGFRQVKQFDHEFRSFRLDGAHRQLPCERCHRPGESLTGQGRECLLCHRDDDAHQLSLGTDCGRCHDQRAWLPARFQHAQTGSALRGAHRTARCRDCHSFGNYAVTPRDCAGCHLNAFIDPATQPNHAEAGFSTRCEECHSQISWSPARMPGRRIR